MTPEGKVKAAVRRALRDLEKCYVFMPVQNGMGAPALDYYLCVNDRFVAIETKAPGKHLTPRQKVTAQAIARAGGAVYVIRNDQDIQVMMDALTVDFLTAAR